MSVVDPQNLLETYHIQIRTTQAQCCSKVIDELEESFHELFRTLLSKRRERARSTVAWERKSWTSV